MYRKVLLAFDGSVEGRMALNEGAMLAKLCGADVLLTAVINVSTGIMMAEGALPGAVEHQRGAYEEVLSEGLQRLREIGLTPTGRLMMGDPAEQIASAAKEWGADLVVVGHRRQSSFARWWRGSVGVNLFEQIDCSMLIAQLDIDPMKTIKGSLMADRTDQLRAAVQKSATVAAG